ncbi:cell division protein ZipA [Marinobacter sp. M1N3S26]|uniref:cell division protein ZipA n=1 Tax=Marinobacter sp. M1N3S26 TaxID=3382299 RepID=UPI00387B0D05
MSLREWLIAIGALIIIAIVLDGLRRMRRARKDAIAISSGMGADDIENSPLDDDYNPELPHGGARPVSRDTLEERGYVTAAVPSDTDLSEPPGPETAEPEPEPESDVPSFTASESEPEPEQAAGLAEEPVTARQDDPAGDEEVAGEMRTVRKPRRPEPRRMGRRKDPEPPTVTDVEEDTASRGGAATEPREGQPKAGANRPPAEEVLVINVLAREQDDFSGKALKKLFEACGLEHGDLDIYHRHETPETTSPVQFSVANAVEPGTFIPDEMEEMSTPGISFFMSVPGPTNSMQAFDFMLETAQAVVRNLGGELKDERRSVMTAQTIEHCRQRIREYERKRRSRH